MTGKSKLVGLFLLKFDVHTGYTLEWSKTVDDKVSLKGLEFKSLPSGLHQTSKDVIAFVEDLDIDSYPQKLVYGVSIFKSNLESDIITDRSDVKMYSLGVLIDSNALDSLGNTPFVWKPLVFTSGWEYIDDLELLLMSWLENSDQELNKYKLLEDFFNKNKLVNNNQLDSAGEPLGRPTDLASVDSIPQQQLPAVAKNHHMLLQLIPLLENLGPLIFKVWKLALLRKKIMLHNAKTIELSSSFVYCISLISTIPQEILPELIASGAKDYESLQFYQPLYNVGVNDITYLDSLIKKYDPGFIVSTTDDILLYKQFLYDYGVKFSSAENAEMPLPLPRSLPEVVSSTSFSKNGTHLKATQRDLRRFRILFDEFNLYEDEFSSEDDVKWWEKLCEPASWKEYIWKGFSWWASLGENDSSDREFKVDKEGLDNISTITEQDSIFHSVGSSKTALQSSANNHQEEANCSKDVIDVLRVVGYFHTMTIKIFRVLFEIINNHDSDDIAKLERATLGETSTDNDTLWIGLNDINEMGLDPYSVADQEFVVELVDLWWKRKARVGNYLINVCC